MGRKKGPQNKAARDLVEALEALGFEFAQTRKGHWLVILDDQIVATIPGTPSDHRSLKNAKAQALRALRLRDKK